jgi:hypothetical protein
VRKNQFYILFSETSQKSRKMITDLYFIYVAYRQIWLNLPTEDDRLMDAHFFHIFLWMIALWLQTKIPKKT